MLIIGLIAGYIAEKVTSSDHGLFTNLLVGIAGGWGWAYAIKNHRLLLPEVTEMYAYQLRDRILAEPITAIITIPMAFFGPILWEISWFTYPLVVWLVKQWRPSKTV